MKKFITQTVNTEFEVEVCIDLRKLTFREAKYVANAFGLDKPNPEDIDLYRFLCDVAKVNYHTPKDELLELVKEKL